MIQGERVVVRREVVVGRDPGNNEIVETVEQPVDDVLVAPGGREDVSDSNRPDGSRVAWQLHFPKSFTGSLRGAEVSVRGLEFARVVGDPHPYTVSNTPGRWNYPAELERTDG